MRLSEIRDYITNILDYDPTNTTFDGQTDDVINDCYRRLFSEKPFIFAQKEAIIQAQKDESLTITPSSGNNSATTTGVFPEWIEGHIIEFNGVEHIVVFRASNTQIYINANFTTGVAGTATFKMRYIDLPQDCIQVMQVAKRSLTITPVEPGRMVPLSRYEDEWYNLPLDEVNMPHYWIQYDDFNIVAPRKVNASATVTGAGRGVRTVDVAMTYSYGNGSTFRESALSAVTSVSLADNQDLLISPVSLGSGVNSGIYRKIYVRCSTENLNVFRLATTSGGVSVFNPTYAVATAFTLLSLANLQSQLFENDNPRYEYPDGNTQRIRLYPRQDALYNLTVRYMYKPPRLVEEHDAPEFPSAHHLVLAYMALEQIYMKTDNLTQSGMYRMKADSEMIKMERRYLTQAPKRFVKQFMPDGMTDAQPIYTALTHTS
jgi:hypothetical protein